MCRSRYGLVLSLCVSCLVWLVSCGGEVTPQALYEHGLVHKGKPVKILARGDLDHALVVKAHAFSEAAKAKIEQAGGRTELIDG